MENQDWRLHGQERYLAGARVRHAQYRAPLENWDHDHCEFCTRKLSEQAGDDVERAGWQTEDGYRWICDACFADFREPLGFVVMRGAPRRGVELHDATVLAERRVTATPEGSGGQPRAFALSAARADYPTCPGRLKKSASLVALARSAKGLAAWPRS